MKTESESSPSPGYGLDFSGKRALVTGGTKGIGRACVLLFARLGAEVAATYSSDEEAADRLRRNLADMPGHHEVFRCDMGDHTALQRAAAELDAGGRLPQILVCNAAYQKKATVRETDLALMERTFRVNVLGNYALIRQIADRLAERGIPGAVIVNSSNQSVFVNPTGFAYSLTKAALNHMVRHLALAYSREGIRVNGMLLGWFDTEGERAFYSKEQIAAQAARNIPLMRAGDPEEAAKLIAYVASDEAGYVTGSLLRIDGGFSLEPDVST
jgi:NAD(P)-dependent dehydrogenase (short-subunit alcohol dehydrogenase family)